MTPGTLVRFWEDGFRTEVASKFVDWDQGWFHIHSDDPLASLLSAAALTNSTLLLTVYSTDELVWSVDSTQASSGLLSVATVHCVPWLERMRHSLISDDYLVWLWLDAEKKHGGAS